MRPAQIVQILDQEFKSTQQGYHTPVMLWGPPGVGKSQMVAQVAENNQVPLIDIRLSQMEPSDLRGIPFRVEERVEWAVPAMLPDQNRHGPQGILFLDEINAAPPSVSAAAYQLILDRRLGEYQIPEGWAIFAAGNRQGDRGVTYVMPAPLANRMAHFEVQIHLDDWVSWAWRKGIDDRIIAFLRFRPDLLFNFDPAHDPVAFPSPRSWEFAHRSLQKFSADLLLGSLQACVGAAAGIELHAFIQSMDQMPDIDRILAGENSPVPEAIDLQYALASALIGRAVKSDNRQAVLSRLLDYAHHFPQKEMGVMLVSDLHRAVGDELFKIESFQNWAKNIGEIMLYA